MKNIKTLLLASLLGFSCSTFAQTGAPSDMGGQGGGMQGPRHERMEGRMDNMRAYCEAHKAECDAKREEMRKEHEEMKAKVDAYCTANPQKCQNKRQ